MTTNRFLVASAMALACVVRAHVIAQASADPTVEEVAGLWGAEMDLGPLVHGTLTIDARESQWRALIAGFVVAVEHNESAVSFSLPGGAGKFRGHVQQGRNAIIGHWIQPTAVVLFNQYATPVELLQTKPGIWRGRVTVLQPRISFYVSIDRGTNGQLCARIRNPEFGWLQRGSYRLQLKDRDLTFTGSQPNNQFTGTYDTEADQLTLHLLNGGPPVTLTRRNRDNAVGFYASTPAARKYIYLQPMADDDGWTTASLHDVGLDPGPISMLIEKILAADPNDDASDVQSILIARHGKLVLEEYFHGFTEERPHDMRSAGKTFAPMLVGIARDHGARVSPDTPVYSLFSADHPFANWDDRKAKVRVKDLMSMTAGYECDEDHSNTAPGNEGAMQSQTSQADWYKYTLDLPMAHDPGGGRAYYCSAELNLAAGVAEKASGRWLPELFYEEFAKPLQFETYHLNLMPTGEVYMGGGAYIRPRDQLKLGQLYLNEGTWHGRRILDADWVKQSLALHASFEDRLGVDHQYGWGWHIHHLKAGQHIWTEYEAGGNGGQLVLILPELDMVIGFTGGAYGDFSAWGPWGIHLVPQYIIVAAAGN